MKYRPPSYPWPWAVILAATLLFAADSRATQESLRTLVRGAGAEWIVGEWTGTNSQGRRIVVEYEWALEGHLLEVDLVVGEDVYEGMITRRPADGVVVETGADNGGGMTQAIWREEGGALISERTATRPNGSEIAVAVVNTQIDADTARASLHGLTADGSITASATETVILKRLNGEKDRD